MMDFRTTLEGAGLRPRDIVADGKIRRCKTDTHPAKRNGWYVLHPGHGLQPSHGAWGDWASGGGEALGRWTEEAGMSRALPTQAQIEARTRARADERAARLAAMRAARDFWRWSSPLRRPHQYLADKGLSMLGCTELRTWRDKLVAPVWHGEWLISVQTISAEGLKRFWPGAPVKSGCMVLERKGAPVTAFCEGLATGLAVFQSVRQVRVVVCFDAGNLLPVVQRLKPAGSVVIAADNDWQTNERRGFNPGLEKARSAAELIGCGVAYPSGIDGSDWADYIKELGSGAARRCEREILARSKYVHAMEAGP